MSKYTEARGVLYMDALGDSARIRHIQPVYATCTVWVPSEKQTEQEFSLIRHELGLRDGYEFHATKLTKKERSGMLPLRLFEMLRTHGFAFEAWCLEVDKIRTHLPVEISGKQLTYEMIAQTLARMPQQRVSGLTLIIDDQADVKKASTVEREMRARIKQVFEADRLGYSIGPIRLRPADQKAGLQLADFLAAALVKPWPECSAVLDHWPIMHWKL